MTIGRILRFVVPGPPVPCARARVFQDKKTGKTRAARPKRTAGYEKLVADSAIWAVRIARWVPAEIAEYVVTLRVYRAARRGDWDNYAKSCTDGMNGIVWPDDRQIVEARVSMFIDRAKPRVEVEVEARGACSDG